MNNLSVSGTLSVNGTTKLNSTLSVVKALTVSDNVSISGTLSVGSDLTAGDGQFTFTPSSGVSEFAVLEIYPPYNMNTDRGVALAFNNASSKALGSMNYVRSNSAANYNSQLDIYTADNGSNSLKVTIGGGGNTYSLDVNGTANISSSLTVAGSSVTSDNRVKHNETTVENALEDIRQLIPLHYFKTIKQYEKDHDFSLNENEEPLDESGNILTKNVDYFIESGFVAQDVYDISNLKFAVKITDSSFNDASMSINDVSDTLGLDYNSITVHAIAALQELDCQLIAEKEKTATLETEVTTLKNQVSTFETQISELMARIVSLENNNSTTTTDASDNTTTTDGS